MTAIPNITLNDGDHPAARIRRLPDQPTDTDRGEQRAEVGYRHIDTAEMYGNEKEVGQAVARSGLDRAEVFVTSKLNNDRHARRRPPAFDRTLKALGFDYIDLFLIHWPLPTVRRRLRVDLAGHGARSTATAGPARSACRTSSRTTCAGCTIEYRDPVRRSTRSRCTRT